MSRLSVGREGSIVSSQAPDEWAEDWAETEAHPVTSSTGRRHSGRAGVTPQLTVIAAALLAVAASAVVLVLVFRQGGDGSGATSGATTSGVPEKTPAATAPATSTLRVKLPALGRIGMGAKGDSVLRLQRALVAIGLDPGARDSAFGPRHRRP